MLGEGFTSGTATDYGTAGATFGAVPACDAIPVDLVAGGRQITEPRLDRSGLLLAYVESDGDGSRFVVVDLESAGSSARRMEPDPAPVPGRGLGGGAFCWTPDGTALVYAAGDGGVWRADLDREGAECVWSGTGAQAPAVSPDGDLVAFMVDQAAIVVVPLAGGEARVVSGSAGPDFAFDPVFAPGGGAVTFQGWSIPDMPWDGAARFTGALDQDAPALVERRHGVAVQQPGHLADGTPVDVCDASGWLNVYVGQQPVVAEPFEHAAPTWGPGQRTWAASPDGRSLVFARNEAGFGRLVVADIASGATAAIGRAVHGQLSWSGDRIAALRTGARTPTEIVVYERDGDTEWSRRRIDTVADARWAEHDGSLVEPELVEVTGDDGVVLYARRYDSPVSDGRLLVWVHGGPTSQWDVSFNAGVAFWVSRGWDVLLVDPRGSSGHGRAYQQALRGQWGVLDVDDTASLIRHSHAAGRSQPSRTMVMGGSSGGLTVLAVLGRHAGLVAGGVALYPVSDIHDLNERSHRFEAHYQFSLVGPDDTAEDRARYWAQSPQSYAEHIAGPLLVLHGTEDPVVPVDQSIAVAERIRAAGGHVELHLLDGEGHGFRQPGSKEVEYRLVESFLDRVSLDRVVPPSPGE